MTTQRLSLTKAAAEFGVSYTFLWEAVRKDELPALNIGRVEGGRARWSVRPEDVEAFLQSIGTPNEAERTRQAGVG